MTRIAGTLALELETSEQKFRAQFRSLVEEIKRTAIPIQLVPTVAGGGSGAGPSVGAGGSPSGTGVSSGPALAFQSIRPVSTAAAQAAGVQYGPAGWPGGTGAWGAPAGTPSPAAQAGGAVNPWTTFLTGGVPPQLGNTYAGGNAFPGTNGPAFGPQPAPWYWGMRGGIGAAAGSVGKFNDFLKGNTPGMFRLIGPLYSALEISHAHRAIETANIRAAFAPNPMEATETLLQGIEQAQGGLWGTVVGEGKNILGSFTSLDSPNKLRRDILMERGRNDAMARARALDRERAAAGGELAAFRAGGANALEDAVAANQRDDALEKNKVEREGLKAVLAGFGGALSPEAAAAKRAELAAVERRQETISAGFQLGESQRQVERRNRRQAIDDDTSDFRDEAMGLPDYTRRRNNIRRQTNLAAAADPANAGAIVARGNMALAAEDFVRSRDLARGVMALNAEVASGNLRVSRQPLAAQLRDILAQGELEATQPGIDPQQAFLARQRASARWYEAYFTFNRDSNARASDLRGESGVFKALLANDPLEAERQAKLNEFAKRLRDIPRDGQADGERRAELDRQTDEWELLRRNQTLTVSLRRGAAQLAERVSGLAAGRLPLAGEVEQIAGEARLRDKQAEAAGADRDERALMLSDAQNRLTIFRNQLTRGAATAGNPFATDFSGTDQGGKDQLEALKRIEQEIQRLNVLMQPLQDL